MACGNLRTYVTYKLPTRGAGRVRNGQIAWVVLGTFCRDTSVQDSSLRGFVVLVVEDNPNVLEATSYMIEAAFGCKILGASCCAAS